MEHVNQQAVASFSAVRPKLRGEPKASWRKDQHQNNSNTESSLFHLWAGHMSCGDFEKAWGINDMHRRRWPSAHVLSDANIQNSRITVKSLHGLGDAVQMLRYAPMLKLAARSVTYQVPSALLPLMPYFRGVKEFGSLAPAGEDESERSHVYLEMMELPYIFRTSLDQLPLQQRYLALPSLSANRAMSSPVVAKTKRIGLVWAGGDWDSDRWIPFHYLLDLLSNSRFEWWNLQGGQAAEQADSYPLNCSRELRDGGVIGLAREISTMDLVISIDTLASHLAGALGVPTWLLLKHDADWRWMKDRADSPWYPATRCFRQARPGQWEGVMREVMMALVRAF